MLTILLENNNNHHKYMTR